MLLACGAEECRRHFHDHKGPDIATPPTNDRDIFFAPIHDVRPRINPAAPHAKRENRVMRHTGASGSKGLAENALLMLLTGSVLVIVSSRPRTAVR